MKIAVIGQGAREHAISEKLLKEKNRVYWINDNNPTNYSVKIKINDFEKIYDFLKEKNIDLIIPGPEILLANGITDFFEKKGIRVIGPKKKYTFLETSKSEAKKFMKRNNVQTADFKIFKNDYNGIIKEIEKKDGKIALKYDFLAAGKGVFVSKNKETALNNLDFIIKNFGNSIIAEEKLNGREISVITITDGETIKILPPATDYKLSADNNKGYNTGGMGAITLPDMINREIMNEIKEKIIYPTLNGFKKENIFYKGFLYFGIMITQKGPFLLEYNIRLGDPETQVILPSLKSSFTELILNTVSNKLNTIKNPSFQNDYYMTLVLAGKGYPLKYETGKLITIPKNNDCDIYYAGVKKEHGKLITSGGRVLNLVGHDKNLNELRKKIYGCAEKIKFDNKYYRKDIGIIYD